MIHQFYFTHCTYATSALERKSGEVAPHPLGYSVRAASMQGNALREIFRRLERYVYYYLPTDTPGNEKETLSATTAPVRLIFLPDTDCGPTLMNLCYRAKDTAGRVGSYFCHALASNADALEKLGGNIGKSRKKEDSGKSALNSATALQLWDASNWAREDAEWFPHDLSALDTLADALGNASPAVDEKVLNSFLTTEPGGVFYDPRDVIPERWRKIPVSERQRYFKTALHGFLATYDETGETLLIVVEPSVAALIFYGICLFFPQTITRNVSFSTFEPLPDRLFTKMAATTFMNPAQNDLSDATYHGKSFVMNTWNGRMSDFKPEALTESYVSHVWKQFLAGGIPQTVAFCKTFSSVGITAISDLKAMMDVENAYHQIMQDGEVEKGRKPLPTEFGELSISGSRMATTLLKRRLADGVAKIMELPLPEAEKTLSKLIGTPGQLLLLELLGKGGNLTEVQGAVRFLTESLPENYVGKWLKQSSASDDYKAQILERWVTQRRTLPAKCDFLWSLTMEAISARTRDALNGVAPPSPNAGVLPMALAKQSLKTLMECFQSPAVQPFQKEMVLAYTWGVAQLVERHGALNEAVQKIRRNLDKFIQQTPESLFERIYYEYGNWFFLNYPGDSMFLGEKFTCLESDIFKKPEEIGAKLKILFDIQDILPEGTVPRIRRWSALQKAMRSATTFQAQPGRKIQSRALDQACETLAQKAYDVFDDARLFALCGGPEATEYERLGKISVAERNRLAARQLQLLTSLCKQWYNVELLPSGNRAHELMQKKMKYYLQTRSWNNAKISALGKRAYILMALGGVGLGLTALLICLLAMGNVGNRGSNTDSGKKADALVGTEENTLATPGEQEENSTSRKSKKKKNDGKSEKKDKKLGNFGKSGAEKADWDKADDLDDSEINVSSADKPKEEVYELKADGNSELGVTHNEEEDALRDAEKVESGGGDASETGAETNAETEKYDADGAYIGDGDGQERDKKKVKSPFLPGKSFMKTEPETLAQWNEELTADRFTRRVFMETNAKIVRYSRNDDFPIVLQGKTDIRDAGGFNEDEARNLYLEYGYILFEGTAYPFGGTEKKSNCVESPKENVSTNEENKELAEDRDSAKKRKPKNVLTREKLERPKLPDEPGRRYYAPELAEALGFEAVIVEMATDTRTGAPILQIKVQRKNADAKKLEEIESAHARLAEVETEIVALQSAITACEQKKNVRDAEQLRVYRELAKLIGKATLIPEQEPTKKGSDANTEEVRVAREKVYTEKMPSILNVGRERLAQRVQERDELERTIPKSATSWTELEENTLQRLQGRKSFDAETQKIKNLKIQEAQTPVIAAVFSGNFMYDVPLPPDAQKMLDDSKSRKKTEGESDLEEDPDPFGKKTLSTGLQPFQMSQEDAGARVQLLYDVKDFEVKRTVKSTRKETTEFRVRFVAPRAKSDASPSPFTTLMLVREIIPGKEKSLDRPPKMVVEGEWMELVPHTETRYFLASFQIRQNGDGTQNGQDARNTQVFVTPYYQFKLNGEQENGKNYELTFALTKDFMQQFRPSKERKPTRKRD